MSASLKTLESDKDTPKKNSKMADIVQSTILDIKKVTNDGTREASNMDTIEREMEAEFNRH